MRDLQLVLFTVMNVERWTFYIHTFFYDIIRYHKKVSDGYSNNCIPKYFYMTQKPY